MRTAAAAALVHFLWQGAAIGALAWLGFAVCRSPRIRYLIGIAALALMAAAPVVTGIFVARAAEVQGPSSMVHGSQPFRVLGPGGAAPDLERGAENGSEHWTLDRGPWTSALESARLAINENAAFVLALWMIGVGALSVRLAGGWFGARRLTQRVNAAAESVQAVASELVARLQIRARVRIVESALVSVPAVVGAFKPVVLLPAAAMSGLSMEQLEALLAHELAHVRRHDYLVNLLQSAVETLLFYHPAVWLVSRRVRQERELCCDDLALAVCSDRVAYASALADLESLRAAPSPALAANGGSLLARVRRILGQDEGSALAGRSKSLAGIAILTSIILLVGSQAARARGVQAIGDLAASIAPGEMQEFVATPPPAVRPTDPAQGATRAGVVGGVLGGVPGGVKGGVPEGGPFLVGAADVVAAEPMGMPSETQVAIERPKEIAPEPQVPVGPAINIGQIVRLEVSVGQVRQAEFNKDYTVQPDGTIVVPYVGSVKAAGLTTASLAGAIAAALSANSTLPGAKVAASIETRREPVAPKGLSVTVQGAVRTPGNFMVREDRNDLLDAIAVAGGFTRGAGSQVFLKRGASPVLIYSKAMLMEGRVADSKVLDGDTITVEVAPHFYVTGYVKSSSSEFNWEPGMTLEKAIALAGGISPKGALNRITIERKDPRTSKFSSVKRDKDRMSTPIQPDDVIKVPAKRM